MDEGPLEHEEWQAAYDRQMAAAVADPVLEEWGVRAYKGHGTSDGVAFVFQLTRGGKVVAWVEDSGTGGGPNVGFWPKAPADAERVREAKAAWDALAARLFPGDGMDGEMLVEAVLVRAGK